LLIDTLYKALARKLNGAREIPAPHDRIDGLEHLDKVIDIDQSPIGRTPRSNPATYTGAFTPIRDWFAGLPEAKARGYAPGRFSFNVKGGRCEACQGDGVIKIEMHFLPDVYVTCDVCKGKRYNRETLDVLFKGKSIADVLDMTVEEGAEFFAAVPAVRDKLETLQRVGLGYIKVGQQATTLSGGEAQRVKLAKELSKRATGRTLYILDEPTTGLHFHDVAKLLEVLHELVDRATPSSSSSTISRSSRPPTGSSTSAPKAAMAAAPPTRKAIPAAFSPKPSAVRTSAAPRATAAKNRLPNPSRPRRSLPASPRRAPARSNRAG
jgi:excinuclease ABC subunit A